MTKVTKIILPSAGLAKRLRPLTNRIPKALVRLNGQPLLAYMLREAEVSGIYEAIVIANPQHVGHFERYWKAHAKDFPGIKKMYIRVQHVPLGDGHAVLQAADLITREPVAVRFLDDIIVSKMPLLVASLRLYEAVRAPIVLLEKVPWALVYRYGIAGISRTMKNTFQIPGKIYRLTSFIEKPSRKEAPSNLIFAGACILSPLLISRLTRMGKEITSHQHDALRLADVFRAMLLREDTVYGYQFQGTRLDCGTLDGFTHAEIFMRTHPQDFFG